VPAGGPIGVLELPGGHCFPRACLHWGWLRGETYLDPLRLVRGGPVRLLPLSVLPSAVRPDPPPTHHRAVLGSSTQARGWAWR
jgi:hypothetical protein